ncbi:hypothetical protein [Micromonospora orduensis]|uniref:hypothetical protein n=1 Tax=Micromonospora orduensis TaxID=1420891 RepID=UPI0033E65790
MTNPPHVLVVTRPTEPGVIDPTYTIECPGVTDDCRSYEDCRPEQAEIDLLDDADDEAPVAHGVRHRHLNDLWMAATDQCYLATDADGVADAADELKLAPGRYPVKAIFDPDFGSVEELVVLAEVAA